MPFPLAASESRFPALNRPPLRPSLPQDFKTPGLITFDSGNPSINPVRPDTHRLSIAPEKGKSPAIAKDIESELRKSSNLGSPVPDRSTLREILRDGYGEFEKTHPLPKHVREAVYWQLICGTPFLGAHAQYCPDGHYVRSHYNSCRHRMCPHCSAIRNERWIRKQVARLLDCDYYHIIFTVSHDFNALWLKNGKKMTDILFSCATQTLFRLLSDQRYLGALPGITGSFQSWDQQLLQHPHCHFIVTAGGLTNEGQWREPSSPDMLLPIALAMRLFRTLFRWTVRRYVREGKLTLPSGMDLRAIRRLFIETGPTMTKWNVFIEPKYSHGNGTIKYIGRYINGGPISNRRIISNDGKFVTFTYKDSKDKGETKRGKEKPMTLPIEEFLRRYLLHVPPPGLQMVRHFGLHQSGKKEELEKCREMLGQPPVQEPQPLDWQTFCAEMSEQYGGEHPERCPVCDAQLISKAVFEARANYPPIEYFLKKAA